VEKFFSFVQRDFLDELRDSVVSLDDQVTITANNKTIAQHSVANL